MDFSVPLLREEITLIAPITKGHQDVQLWVYVEIFPVIAWAVLAVMIFCSAIGFLLLSGHASEDSEKFTLLHGLAATSLLFIQLDYPLQKR